MADPDDVVTPYAPKVEHTAKDVHQWLDEDWRAQFQEEWDAALDTAKTSYDIAAVFAVVEKWWPLAQLCAKPGARAHWEATNRQHEQGTLDGIPYDPFADED
jgi:hypothetical protein